MMEILCKYEGETNRTVHHGIKVVLMLFRLQLTKRKGLLIPNSLSFLLLLLCHSLILHNLKGFCSLDMFFS